MGKGEAKKNWPHAADVSEENLDMNILDLSWHMKLKIEDMIEELHGMYGVIRVWNKLYESKVPDGPTFMVHHGPRGPTRLEQRADDILDLLKKGNNKDVEAMAKKARLLKRKITLEVGHGPHPEGFEPGAVDKRTGTEEWKMNHVCALACKKRLDDYGFTNVLVTDEDNYLSHIGRNNKESDVFVSIHHNAFSSDAAQGAEALVHDKLASDNDRKLAQLCSKYFAGSLEINDRGVKNMGLSVLSGAMKDVDRGDQAVCLVEPYFITGGDVDDHSEWSRKAGMALSNAITEYLKELD